MKNWIASALVAGSMLLAACAATSTGPAIGNTRLPGLGAGGASFDVVAIDQVAHRLYVADRTDAGVDVFDVSAPAARYVKTIPVTDPSGIALAPDLGEVFVGAANGLNVIDERTGSPTADKVIKQIPTGTNSVDLVDYAPTIHRLFASNGSHGTVSVLDTGTDTITAVFDVGYPLEQPRFNPVDGSLYVTSPQAAALFQLDATTGKIKNKIAMTGCGIGLAIDPKLDEAVVACDAFVEVVDLRNTSSTYTLVQVAGGDVVTYDSSVDRFFVAVPNMKPSTVGILGGAPIAYISSVDTNAGGNSAAFDETNKLVYALDTRPGRAGLDSFAMPSGEPTLNASWTDMVIFAGMLAGIAVLMVLVGRHADPINRPQPIPRRGRTRPQA